MPEVINREPEDHKKIYEALIQRCKQVKKFKVRCIVDEAWTGFKGVIPFDLDIIDGIFICYVVAFTQREAQLKVIDILPVLKFLDELE